MSYDAVPDSKPVGAAENVTDSENEDAVATLVEKPKCCCPCWNRRCFSGGNRRAYVTVLVLFLINLLNYMDRQTIPGLLDGIQKYFGIVNNDSVAGLLQTVFICSYMLLAPVFGFLGDRYKRKYIMAAGILVWSGTVFASTLLNKDSFWWFLALRGVVGIGEASYSTIAPTVIGDLFTGDMRTKMLSVFYFAIPVGSGLGYIVGTTVAGAFHDKWQWGLRATPMLGAVCVLLCVFVVHEPKRGAIERGENPNAVSASNVHNTSSWLSDLKHITTVKSFIWLTLGFTCVAFVTGALAFWAPKFLLYASHTQGIDDSKRIISLKVGGITCAAGILGVGLGAEIAQRYRVRNRKADALVCAFGLLSSVPFLYVCLLLADKNIKVTYALIFFGEVLLFMNWAPVGDMVLYIIIPARRSTASAVQILVSHLLGDAGSPWLVGKVSDLIRGSKTNDAARATSMEYSLLMTTFISALGGFCFIMCSFYLEKDREKADEYNRTHDDESSLLSSVAADNYPSHCCGNQTLENDDDDDDHLIGREPDTPTTPTPSEGQTLVVPVDVHSSVPVQEIHGNHVM